MENLIPFGFIIFLILLIQCYILRWIFRINEITLYLKQINEMTLYLKQIRDVLHNIHLLIAKEKKE